MEIKINKKPLFILLLVILIVLGISTLLLYKYPEFVRDYYSTIIGTLAFILSFSFWVWERYIQPKPKPIREYHIEPQNYYGTNFNPFTLKTFITNTGNVDINIIFAWVDFDGSRFEFKSMTSSTGKQLESDITISAHSRKEVYVRFEAKENNIPSSFNDLDDAIKKSDLRIVEALSQTQGKLVWYDSTDRSQEKSFPLGWFLKEIARVKIETRK